MGYRDVGFYDVKYFPLFGRDFNTTVCATFHTFHTTSQSSNLFTHIFSFFAHFFN